MIILGTADVFRPWYFEIGKKLGVDVTYVYFYASLYFPKYITDMGEMLERSRQASEKLERMYRGIDFKIMPKRSKNITQIKISVRFSDLEESYLDVRTMLIKAMDEYSHIKRTFRNKIAKK